MGLLSRFKLQKLKIGVYSTRTRSGLATTSFEVMFNPTSLSMSHENVFEKCQGFNSSGNEARYAHSRSEELSLDLIIDGTGVDQMGLMKLLKPTPSVTKQVDSFLESCFYMDGDLHEPKFLRISWGDGVLQSFDCRLKKVDIKYTAFERSGAPMRAELQAVFVEDIEQKKRQKLEGKSSPDLSHSRIVRNGDSLPQMCIEIYGSAEHYLRVARANGLNNFRVLEPGQEIIFPPIPKGATST